MFADSDAATACRTRRRRPSRRRPFAASLAAILFIALPACDSELTDPDPACGDAPTLPIGETRTGTLSRADGDPSLDGSLIDYYAIRPATPGTLTVEMAAEEAAGDGAGVDPFLYLWGADLEDPVAQAWDSTGAGPLLRARLSTPVGAGCYRIGASTWPDAPEGEYTIRADFVPAT